MRKAFVAQAEERMASLDNVEQALELACQDFWPPRHPNLKASTYRFRLRRETRRGCPLSDVRIGLGVVSVLGLAVGLRTGRFGGQAARASSSANSAYFDYVKGALDQ